MSRALRMIICFLSLAALACLLCGCSFFSSVANGALAFASSENLAKSYIHKKYGIDAQPLGYDAQTSGSLAKSVQSTVTVPMRYENVEFCVFLDMTDPTYRFDNYQRKEVSAILEEHLVSSCHLPKATYSHMTYNMGPERAFVGDTTTVTKLGWSGSESSQYDSSCMLSFKYEGQSAEELLRKITTIRYTAVFSDKDKILGSMKLPRDMATTYKADICMSLWNYEDPDVLETNVNDKQSLYGFVGSRLDPENVTEAARRGADEVRYYNVYWWKTKGHNGEPEITDNYADCTK